MKIVFFLLCLTLYTCVYMYIYICAYTYMYICTMCQVRDEAMKAGRQPTRESVWSYFVKKSASNLHIVLCMSPIGEVLKTRCRNFPGLVNNTSIDWFTAWPKQALQAVASQFLAEVRLVHQHLVLCAIRNLLMGRRVKICLLARLTNTQQFDLICAVYYIAMKK